METIRSGAWNRATVPAAVRFTSIWHQMQFLVSSETIYVLFSVQNNTKNEQAVPAVVPPNHPPPPPSPNISVHRYS